MLERNNNLYCAFVDTEKAFDKRSDILVPSEESGARKHCEIIVEELYNGATTACRVRTECGVSAEFPVTVGLHQGSALSRFLFVVVIQAWW